MGDSILTRTTQSDRDRKAKAHPSYSTVKHKKVNMSKIKNNKMRKCELKKIDHLINLYIVSQQLYQDVPSFTDVRNMHKKLKDAASQELDTDDVKRKLLDDIGVKEEDSTAIYKDLFDETIQDTLKVKQENPNRSPLSECDSNTTTTSSRYSLNLSPIPTYHDSSNPSPINSSRGNKNHSILSSTTKGYAKGDHSILSSTNKSYSKKESILNTSDRDLSDVFSKLTLRKNSREKSAKARKQGRNTSHDKENMVCGTLARTNGRRTRRSSSGHRKELKSPSGNKATKSVSGNTKTNEKSSGDRKTKRSPSESKSIRSASGRTSSGNRPRTRQTVKDEELSMIKLESSSSFEDADNSVLNESENDTIVHGRAGTRSNIRRRENLEMSVDARCDNNGVKTNVDGKRHFENAQDDSVLMQTVLESTKTSGGGSSDEYYSQIEDTVWVELGDRCDEYVDAMDTSRRGNGQANADSPGMSTRRTKKNVDAEQSAVRSDESVVEDAEITVVARQVEFKVPSVSISSREGGTQNVEFRAPAPPASREGGPLGISPNFERDDAVSQFNRLLKNVTVRRGRKIVIEDPDTTLQRSKVSLAPGKMWKRSLLDRSVRNRESHKFCRSFVSYSEHFSSTVSFKSLRSTSLLRHLGDTTCEDSLYETVLSASIPYDDNEFCRRKILEICRQDEVLGFEDRYPTSTLKNCRKIGEGVYGEVFKLNDSVIKIMPIEGSEAVNGEEQKKFREIFSEIMVTKETSDLQYRQQNSTPCFTELLKCSCVKGRYPDRLISLWEEFQKTKKSYNDHPEMFEEDQTFIILELKNGGNDSGDIKYRSPNQTYSMILQVLFSLAVAEVELEFEHRDLHMSNILVQATEEDEVPFTLDDTRFELKSANVRATLIDFTISRCFVGEKICYYDLSQDEELFEGEGDYQFEMYRMMRSQCGNNWQNFTPKNNIVWIHYLAEKAMNQSKGYRYLRAPRHAAFELLQELEANVLRYDSCYEMVQDMCSPHSTEFALLKKSKLIRNAKRK